MGKITYSIHPELSLVHFFGVGDISLEMIIKKIGKLHHHPKWSMHFNTFVDFRDASVNTEHSSLENYRKFFDGLQTTGPVRKWAIYTHQEQTHRIANVSHLLLSHTIIVDVFHRRKEALNFLGITEEQFDASNVDR